MLTQTNKGHVAIKADVSVPTPITGAEIGVSTSDRAVVFAEVRDSTGDFQIVLQSLPTRDVVDGIAAEWHDVLLLPITGGGDPSLVLGSGESTRLGEAVRVQVRSSPPGLSFKGRVYVVPMDT